MLFSLNMAVFTVDRSNLALRVKGSLIAIVAVVSVFTAVNPAHWRILGQILGHSFPLLTFCGDVLDLNRSTAR